jgi:hypothetical protein
VVEEVHGFDAEVNVKSAAKQQRSKAFYLGTSANPVYSGAKTQPGYAGLRAGAKLARKARRGKL